MRRWNTVKTLSGADVKYRKWNEFEIGDIVIGTYESVSLDNYKKNSYKISVLDAQLKDGSGDQYVGKTLALNANGMLDKAMNELEKGTIVQIEYLGKDMMEKGPYAGKEAHKVGVSVVEEDGQMEFPAEDLL